MQHTTYSKGIVMTPIMNNAIAVADLADTSVETLVAGARSIAFQLTGTTITTRSAILTVTVSLDNGTTYQAYSMLVSNSANSNSQEFTRVASITRAATGTDIFWMTPETLGAITHIKTTLAITDTGSPVGTFTVKASIAY